MLVFVLACLIESCLHGSTEGNARNQPRMIFTQQETKVLKVSLPGDYAAVPILLKEHLETVIAAGQRSLNSYNFKNPIKTVERKIQWNECGNNHQICNYNITMVNKREEANQVYVCGTNGVETLCCTMNLSDADPTCNSSDKMKNIETKIRGFVVQEGDPYVLVESAESADLFVTYSGSRDFVGIHKFGKDKVGPPNHDKEQYYKGLIPITHSTDSIQDKLYGFYNEKNKDTGMYSGTWIPFVTRVCMADVGGPKSTLQFSWTSQLNAKLFCGDPDSRQHFSELVDVATVHAERWQDTRVYALFKNEWGMSAVCVYTIQDMDNIFATSQFIDESAGNENSRPRGCVDNSKKIPLETLKMIEKSSEMKQWVQPVNNSAPLLFNHHHYTHISADSSQHRRGQDLAVLFLSLHNGRIHKVLHSRTQTLVISEYRPFDQHADIFSLILHPASRKLYLKSRSELVQLDVAKCSQYGDRCEDCVLARDPYCTWNGTQCISVTQGKLQDVTNGNHNICSHQPKKEFIHSPGTYPSNGVNTITLPAQSKYFLSCPMSSHHAQYTWTHRANPMSCSLKEQQCLVLIESMSSEQEGTYKCVSEEMGYTKVLAQYKLQLENRATGRLSGSLIWVCLLAVMIKSLSC